MKQPGFLKPNRTSSSYSSFRSASSQSQRLKFDIAKQGSRKMKMPMHAMYDVRPSKRFHNRKKASDQQQKNKSYNPFQTTYQRELSRVPQRQVTRPWPLNNKPQLHPHEQQYSQVEKPGVNVLILDSRRPQEARKLAPQHYRGKGRSVSVSRKQYLAQGRQEEDGKLIKYKSKQDNEESEGEEGQNLQRSKQYAESVQNFKVIKRKKRIKKKNVHPNKFNFQISASGDYIPVFRKMDEGQGQQGKQESEQDEKLPELNLTEEQVTDLEDLLSLNKKPEKIAAMLQIDFEVVCEYIRRKNLPEEEITQQDQMALSLPQLPNPLPLDKMNNKNYHSKVQQIDELQRELENKYSGLYEDNQQYFDKLTDTRFVKKRKANYTEVASKPWIGLKTKYHGGYKSEYNGQYQPGRQAPKPSDTLTNDFYTQKIKSKYEDYNSTYRKSYHKDRQQEPVQEAYTKYGIHIPKQVQYNTSQYQSRFPNYQQTDRVHMKAPQYLGTSTVPNLEWHGKSTYKQGFNQATLDKSREEVSKSNMDLKKNGVIINRRDFNNMGSVIHSQVKFAPNSTSRQRYQDSLRQSQRYREQDPQKVERNWILSKKHQKKQLYHQFDNQYNTSTVQHSKYKVKAERSNNHRYPSVPINSSSRKYHNKQLNDQHQQLMVNQQLLNQMEMQRQQMRGVEKRQRVYR